MGAPWLFLANALSYIYSGVSLLFIKPLPSQMKVRSQPDLGRDIREGLQKVRQTPGLLFVFLVVACLNFFGYIVFIMYLPMFTLSPSLGIAAFGPVMAASVAGSLLGQALWAKLRIQPDRRCLVFCLSGFLSNALLVAFPFAGFIWLLMLLIFLSGMASSGINIALSTALQLNVEPEYQGRVFSLMGMIGGLLVPLAMVFGGLLGETGQFRLIIAGAAVLLSLIFVYPAFNAQARRFFAAT
jgi:MFS family permease